MKIYKDLYVSEDIADKKDAICRKLKMNFGIVDAYLIVISKGEDQLEIYHSFFLKQPYLKKQNFFVVGLAKHKESALLLVERITDDVFKATGDANLKSYFLHK